MNVRLAFPIMLVYALHLPLPLREGRGVLYERECIFDAVREGLFQPMTERAITPVDLAGQCIEFDEEIGKFLIVLHVEVIEFRFCSGLRIRVSKHIAEFLYEICPVAQPVRGCEIQFLFIFKLGVKVTLGGTAQVRKCITNTFIGLEKSVGVRTERVVACYKETLQFLGTLTVKFFRWVDFDMSRRDRYRR